MDELIAWLNEPVNAWWIAAVIVPSVVVGWALGLVLWALTDGRRERARDAQPRLIEHTAFGTIELAASVTDDELDRWIKARGGPGWAGPATLMVTQSRDPARPEAP